MLDRALAEPCIHRAQAYLTNAVKHFKYEPRGKKRLRKRPNPSEVKRYRWWLHKELALVRPPADRLVQYRAAWTDRRTALGHEVARAAGGERGM
jgi:uracil-DNA glycosylase